MKLHDKHMHCDYPTLIPPQSKVTKTQRCYHIYEDIFGISWAYLGILWGNLGDICGIAGSYLEDILWIHFWDIFLISGGNLGISGDIWGGFGGYLPRAYLGYIWGIPGGYLRYILGISGGCILEGKLGISWGYLVDMLKISRGYFGDLSGVNEGIS